MVRMSAVSMPAWGKTDKTPSRIPCTSTSKSGSTKSVTAAMFFSWEYVLVPSLARRADHRAHDMIGQKRSVGKAHIIMGSVKSDDGDAHVVGVDRLRNNFAVDRDRGDRKRAAVATTSSREKSRFMGDSLGRQSARGSEQ